MMNLFEGNHCDGQYVSADTYWGSSSHNTYFRNRIAVDPTKSAQEVTVALDYRSYYYNIIGNVLGDGREESYVLGELPYGPNTIFSFEWSGSDSTEETSLIHANYDYFHAAQTPCDHADNPGCQSASDDMTLPDSLYLDSKPAFFGTQPWPPVDPSVPSVADLPAKIYYDTRSWPVP